MEWLAIIISLFNPKAKAFVKGRKQTLSYLENEVADKQQKLAWVHASSVGEYEQGRPVMEALKAKYPDINILVSFYSPSGYEAVKTDEIVDYTCYLPLDSKYNASKFIQLIQPTLALFIKYEFWHYYLKELSAKNVPTFSVSAIFRKEQAFFKWYGQFFKNMLGNFNYFFVQDESSKHLLNTIGIESTITGDTRLDRVLAIRDSPASFPDIEQFVADKPVFIIGSMRKEDLKLVIQFIKQTPDYQFIIAPHEITEEMMVPLENHFSTIRYSANTTGANNHQVLIIDTIGMLSKIYRYGDYAYVGGGFSDGIHNILEPAVYQLPVFFGNKDYKRFKEAIDLTKLGVAFSVGSANELIEIHRAIATDTGLQADIQSKISTYLDQNRGASKRIVSQLSKFIKL